ncbi:hypothetical protein V5O48_003157 [Marasmius crinis-equi]|uniref:Rhodopsin domain-containing protein n=1 Tax=Marasmius crinis-equi TaxID=585013 RepID=A0ABR3FUN4_9AGAR
MSDPYQSSKGDLPNPFDYPPSRALVTIFHSLAIIFTLVRLARRFRIRRVSWDDAWALVSMLLVAAFLGMDWERLRYHLPDWETVQAQPPADIAAFHDRLILFYRLSLGLYSSIVWCSRISLSLSIARILPPSRLRLTANSLAVFCLVAGIILTVIKPFLCTVLFPPRVPFPNTFCRPGNGTVFSVQAAGDVISSVLLVIIPIYALRYTDIPSCERRLIVTLFASTSLTLASCLVHAVYIAEKKQYRMALSSRLEAAISVMVCNLLVVVTSLYRLLRCGKQDDDEDDYSSSDTTRHEYHYNSGEEVISISIGEVAVSETSSIPQSLAPSELTQLEVSRTTNSLRSISIESMLSRHR